MILNKRGEWNGVKFSRIRLESVEEDSEKDPEIEVELQGRDERKRKSEGRKNWKKTEVQKRKVTGSDLDRDSDKQDDSRKTFTCSARINAAAIAMASRSVVLLAVCDCVADLQITKFLPSIIAAPDCDLFTTNFAPPYARISVASVCR